MGNLAAVIENVSGTGLRRISNFRDLTVTEPLNDSITAKLTLSMYDWAAQEVLPLERVLTVVYDGFLVFRGRFTRPIFNFQQGTVEINAHDATLALKHHYHAFGDEVVEFGYPIDGRGLRMLCESSVPLEVQADAGMIPSGYLYGEDLTTHQEGGISDDDSIWRRVERGANVWESVQNLSQIVGAPDFHFRPVHPDFPGINGSPPAGFYAELDCYDRRGEDQSSSIIFEHGFGKKNAENVIWEPDGTSVRNFWVQVYPGGDRSSTDDQRRARVLNGDSINAYGMMMGWESSGQKDAYKSLVQKAKAWVRAYAFPPDYFTVVPGPDKAGTPKYRDDYNVGDTILARGKKGYVQKEIEGRIIQATLSQVNANSQTKVDLSCVPTVGTSEVIVLDQDT